MTPLLFDTDVLIDYLRGHPAATGYLETLQAPVFTSAITVAELYASVREGEERARLESSIQRPSCYQ